MTDNSSTITKRILRICLRLIISTFLVASFFILTQDIQIFPGTVSGFFSGPQSEAVNIPDDIAVFFVTTSDREQIETWYLQSTNEKAVAIVFHGNADSLYSTYSIQRWLARDGISSYSFDYRGYGRSSGFPSEQGIYRDAEAVYHAVKNRDLPLIVLGISIGTGPASYLATQVQPDIVLLLSPYSSLTRVVRETPLLGYLTPFLKYTFPVKDYLASVRNACIIIAHGTKDSTIPVSHSRELKEHYPEIIYSEFKEAGHNSLLSVGHQHIKALLLNCLKPPQSSSADDSTVRNAAGTSSTNQTPLLEQ